MSPKRLAVLLATFAAVAGVLVLALGPSPTEAHPSIHPQKKLFGGRWYKAATMDLTTSQPWFVCDSGNTASCASKWYSATINGLADWNNQPTTVRFQMQPNQDLNHDINVIIADTLFNDPNILGVAIFYNSSEQQCNPDACTYRWGEAYAADDPHSGVWGTEGVKRGTIAHELGHLLSLRHESVNPDESFLYPCGFDNTGSIPHSVMAYDCIDPPAVGGAGEYYVQDWDTCGINHAYLDAAYEWEECHCYPPPAGGALPALPPSYYHPVTPARILDTRPPPIGPIGAPAGRLGHGCHMNVDVTDTFGSGVPASGVSAVVLNVTVTGPSQASHLTIYPSDASLPLASNLNFVTLQTVPNLVTVRVGADGRVKLFNNSGQTHVIFDVVGWYDATPAGAPPDSAAGQTPGTTMAIDADPSGNSSSAIGAIQTCARIQEDDVQNFDEDVVDGLIVDVAIRGIPAFNDGGTAGDSIDDSGGIIDYEYDVNYPQAQLTVQSKIDPPTDSNVNKLFDNAGSGPVDDSSDPLPDDNVNSVWVSSVLDFADTAASPAEDGDGVLDRLTITTEESATSGEYAVTLSNQRYSDASDSPFVPGVTAFTSIAVNQACRYGYYHPLTPSRILDTRYGTGGISGQLGPSNPINVQVTGRGGVPASGVTAVVLNTTVTGPTAPSHLTVYPAGASLPLASNLNFLGGQTVPNLVTVKVGTGGQVSVNNYAGFTYLIFDVVGWYGGPVDGSLFNALQPARILDTRTGPQGVPPGAVGPGQTISVQATNVGGVPPVGSGVKAVIVNTTVTGPTAPSHLTVYPSDAALPLASNLNFVTGQTVPNLVIVKVGADGKVNATNCCGQVHVIFDVVGYFQ